MKESSESSKQLNSQTTTKLISTDLQVPRLSLKTPIDGSYIIENFITEQEEIELINSIDLREWSGNGIP